jgi:hypothetical protein
MFFISQIQEKYYSVFIKTNFIPQFCKWRKKLSRLQYKGMTVLISLFWIIFDVSDDCTYALLSSQRESFQNSAVT